jgi:type I restriction enzyme, S subunit
VKDGWSTERLGDHVVVQNGYAFSSGDYSPVGHFVMRIANVQNGYVSRAEPKYITLPVDGSLDRFVLSGGDILMSLTGNIGRVGLVEEDHLPAVLNQRVARINVRSGAKLSSRYLLYFLRSDEFRDELSSAGHGVAQQNVSTKELVEIKLPVPSMPEQQSIVAILDEAFDGIATAKTNAEKNLQNARELFTSQLERVFSEPATSWRRVALESIGATQTGSTPKSSEPEDLGNHLPFVKPGDFNRDGSIRFDNEGLSESGARKARRVQANSALMVCIGATIGKAGFSEREIATNQQVNAWTPTTKTSAKFIYYQMTTSDFQRRVRQSAGQATLPIINKSKWSALTVVVPPTLDEQAKIVADLDILLAESMNLEAVYEGKLAALDALKKSLLHQAFTGALTAKSTDRQLGAVA